MHNSLAQSICDRAAWVGEPPRRCSGPVLPGHDPYYGHHRKQDLEEVCRDLLVEQEPSLKGTHRLEIAPGSVRGRVPYKRPSGPPEFVDVQYTDLTTGELVTERRPCPTRGKIGEFSAKSRRNLLGRLSGFAALPDLFDTLTYPGEWSRWESPEAWKRHLDTFGKRLLRRYPTAYAEWKLEPQRRGAPHFHLLVWLGFRPSDDVHQEHMAWLSQAWAEVVNHPDPHEYTKHLRHGSDSQRVEGGRAAVMSYVSKYVGKPITGGLALQWRNPGRWWGSIGTCNRPVVSRLDVVLHETEYRTFRRLVRRWVRSQQYRPHLQGPGLKLAFKRLSVAQSSHRYAQRLARFDTMLLFMPESVALQLAQAAIGQPVPATLVLKGPGGSLDTTAGVWDRGVCVDAWDQLASLPPAFC